jgi:hypothetical protein
MAILLWTYSGEAATKKICEQVTVLTGLGQEWSEPTRRKSNRDIGTSIGATSSQSAAFFLNLCQIFIYSAGLGNNKK